MPIARLATLNNFITIQLGEDPATYEMTYTDYVHYHQWLKDGHGGGPTGNEYLIDYYAALAANPDDTLSGYAPGGVSPVSVVHVSFPENFNFTMDAMRTEVKLANNANLTTTGGVSPKEQVLGDIFIGGLDLTVQQGGWIDIWAH